MRLDITTLADALKQDHFCYQALLALQQQNLNEGYLAAGFVRNFAWDLMHGYAEKSQLNDVDVIYFDADDLSETVEAKIEQKLSRMMPTVHWQVRNQARMHHRNQDPPYLSSIDAMGYWPEKETAVAARLNTRGEVELVSAFGFDSLFQGQITSNPKRCHSIFRQRVQDKGWLRQWPNLTLFE